MEVDGGGSVGEPEPVAGDAAVGDSSAGADQPGEAAFDHGPPASVVVGEVAVAPGSAGFGEFGVVVQRLSFGLPGRWCSEFGAGSRVQCVPEDGVPAGGDADGVAGGAGDGAGG